MKLGRLLLLVLAFGPCPHDWARITAALARPESPVLTVQTPEKDCCGRSCNEQRKEPAPTPDRQECGCRQKTYVTQPTLQVPGHGDCGVLLALSEFDIRGSLGGMADVSLSRPPIDTSPGGFAPLLI